MERIKVLENIIRHYVWGSTTAIPELLNIPPSPDLPCAELWMGAHPGAPSSVIHEGRKVGLDVFVEKHPVTTLGKTVAEKFENTLPFLFKVLAAAAPLSIQAHPDKAQAEEGFLRENRAGIPLDAPERNYKDANHKPECICAVTPFFALCGFRSMPDINHNISTVLPDHRPYLITDQEAQSGDAGLKSFFHRLLVMDPDVVGDILGRAVDAAGRKAESDIMCRWVIRLHQAYPDDIMALAPAFLNLIELAPHQALYLPAGVLHAYLEGVGVELMANSDNVLRGGLTPKHVDVGELLSVLDFSPTRLRVLTPTYENGCEGIFATSAEEFVLSMLRVMPGKRCFPDHPGRVAVLLCVEGRATLTDDDVGQTIELGKGKSVMIPASVDRYSLDGEALIFKAAASC